MAFQSFKIIVKWPTQKFLHGAATTSASLALVKKKPVKLTTRPNSAATTSQSPKFHVDNNTHVLFPNQVTSIQWEITPKAV